MVQNPILWMDYPDPDVIRVGGVYYMISTTMHFMPGGVILRSYDLAHWEIASYVYQTLDDTAPQRLEGAQNIYGKGMWAASLRYHNGTFFVCFVANDTHKTYLYRSETIEGPWRKQTVEGFYHDCSLLFDDDGETYIVYGNTDIYITQLNRELTGPKEGGLHRMVLTDRGNDVQLGYEGAHFYKINGVYYLFFIHWPRGGHRVQACFRADDLRGAFTGGDILDDTLGYADAGVAQGGIVDTPDGRWYAMLFQDHGAVGRIPVLIPLRWKDGFPVLGENGKVPPRLETASTRPGYAYAPLYADDDFRYTPDADGHASLKTVWQWNHTPDGACWALETDPPALRLTADKLCPNVTQAKNTLTQRMCGPRCEACVTVDGRDMREGDVAGLCALEGDYGLIGLRRERGGYALTVLTRVLESDPWIQRADDREPGVETASVPVPTSAVRLKLCADFSGAVETAAFFWQDGDTWRPLGAPHPLRYRLDHFVGCRFGLFHFATRETGGAARFSEFAYMV